MKKIYTLCIAKILFFCFGAEAQPQYQWGYTIGSTSTNVQDYGKSIATDGLGNMYVAGEFCNTMDADPGPGITNLVSIGGFTDIFLSKFNSSGSLLWAFKIGASDGDTVFKVYVDASQHVYLAGSFRFTVDFDPGAGVANLSSSGLSDGFFAKYDANGNYVWAKPLRGNGTQFVSSINVDASGNVFITGGFNGSMDVDPGPATINIGSIDAHAVFLAKYDAVGNYVWAFPLGSAITANSVFERGTDVTATANGDVLLTGTIYQNCDFDPGPAIVVPQSNGTQEEVFLAKYTSSGALVWVRILDGNGADGKVNVSMATDAAGDIYITGEYTSAIFVVNQFPPYYTLTSSGTGESNIFLVKFDAGGNFLYGKSIGGTSNSEFVFGIYVSNSGTVYMTGSFGGTVDFDAGPGTANLIGNNVGIFFAKYDTAGNYVWAHSVTTTITNSIPSYPTTYTGAEIAFDGINLFVCGTYAYTTGDFDPGSINTVNFTSIGGMSADIFFARYSDCSVAPAQPAAISGAITVCNGATTTYSITPVSGATSYTWVLPPGWTGTSLTNSITATSSATSGNITVTANNACGSSTVQTLAVTVATPTVTATASSPAICIGSLTTLTGSGAATYSWMPGSLSGTSVVDSPTANTTYTVTGTDANGCVNTGTVSVTVNPLPTVSYVESQTLVCINWNPITLSAASPAGGTYSGPGVTGNQFDPVVATQGIWNIVYTYSDVNGCADSVAQQITVDLCTGILNDVAVSEIEIFPNPFNDVLTVQCGIEFVNGGIKIYDLIGREIFSSAIINPKTEINLAEFPSGIYFVRIISSEGIRAKQIIKQ